MQRKWSKRKGIGFYFRNCLKIAKSPIGKELGKTALENAPEIYKKAISKVKNKRLEKILQSC